MSSTYYSRNQKEVDDEIKKRKILSKFAKDIEKNAPRMRKTSIVSRS